MSTSTVQRHRWNFIEHPERPSLTALEVNYWKSLLNKLIKVGAEIEFNLSSGKGLCKSYNIACGCKYLTTHTCWTRCAVGLWSVLHANIKIRAKIKKKLVLKKCVIAAKITNSSAWDYPVPCLFRRVPIALTLLCLVAAVIYSMIPRRIRNTLDPI